MSNTATMDAAYAQWLRSRGARVDDKAFKALAKAARSLAEALAAFPLDSPELARLLALLQAQDAPQAQEAYRAWLTPLPATLDALARAADAQARPGAGRKRDAAARLWCVIAADYWYRDTGKPPADSVDSPFLVALATFKPPEGQPIPPAVSRSILQKVLPPLRASRAQEGNST